MEIIYVDSLFFLNFIIDYLLLVLSFKLCGEPIRRLRCALGAALGALYAVLCFLPGFGVLNSAPGKVLLWGLISFSSFFGCGKALRCALGFLAVSAAFGGGVWAASMLAGGGYPYAGAIRLDLRTLVFAFAACYAVLSLAFPRRLAARHETARLSICLRERTVSLTALRDTGNGLREGGSGRRVIIAGIADLAPLFTAGEAAALSDPDGAAALMALSKIGGAPRFVPVSYRAVGVSSALLPAFTPDSLLIDGERDSGCVVAVSPGGVSGDGYRALM